MPISMRIVFFIVVVLLHIFIYFMLFKNISPTPAIKHLGKFIVIANFLCIAIFLRLYHTQMNAAIYTILSSSIGVFWICVNVALLVLIVNTIVRLGFGYLTLYEWQGKILLVAWVAIFALVALSFYINAREPKIVEQEIKIANLKQPLSIALITDLHIDVLMDKKSVAKIVEQTNALNADIVVLGGDIVDNYYKIVQDSVLELRNLKGKYGVFYALGNHEYHYDTYTIIKSLDNLGINTLINQSMVLNNLGLNVAGVADLMGRFGAFKDSILAPNLDKTLSSSNSEYPTILISHQPKIIRELGSRKIDLVLSGHTHGGQLFPFHLLVLLDQPFLQGLHEFEHDGQHSQIYISSGAGWWGMPMRLFSRREISLLRLVGE
ncbi:metallophosphoesterase [Helicobacter saguini]|uniref:Metallophosphoesterase n=1 Tax=Helicobacter saguini TaxID=1548018 RepID=A0A347VND8_9HELI|nr:metallophosphoesterase [Helicobacter saguini]MWV61807.1 metallophosphoesterase [Helicobacter saguini]MWV67518.1 metallophosphoesterase [Helicobacter saguini]MWV69869.1 metallophosphoesterase [Helicobacter saguini]MWV72913.1 metallophosphoesterase [Helicobacter saguini]TLD93265.1 metallophosphoesterase [Helicobacter saguini]